MSKKNSSKSKEISTEYTKFQPGELQHFILAILGMSLVIAGSVFITPNFPIVVGLIIKLLKEEHHVKASPKQVKRVLKQLEKKQLISVFRSGDELEVKIRDNNNINIAKYSLKKILALKSQKRKWQGKWFMLLFDVPEKERLKRDVLRGLLCEIGFYPYQQSVYVFPYKCKEEAMMLKKIIEGGKYMRYVEVNRLEDDKALRSYFKL